MTPFSQSAAATRQYHILLSSTNKYSLTQYLLHKNCGVQSPMKPPNVTYFRQSDLKYAKNDLKPCKNDLKYYDLKWYFPLGDLYDRVFLYNKFLQVNLIPAKMCCPGTPYYKGS